MSCDVTRLAAGPLLLSLLLGCLPLLECQAQVELVEGLSTRPLSWHSTGLAADTRSAGHQRHWPWRSKLRKLGQQAEHGNGRKQIPAEMLEQQDQQQQQPQLLKQQQKKVWTPAIHGSDKDHLLRGVERDLEPFRHHGITLQMVEQVYCTFNLQSFRVQILDNQIYIVGELPGFADLNLRNKKILALLAARYPDDLPDVDFIIQNSDWFPPNFNGSHEDCRQQGPMFTANKRPGDSHGILFPDESWLDWEQEKSLVVAAARRQAWESRDSRLLFRGAPTGERGHLLNSSVSELQNDLLNIQVVDEWWSQHRDRYMSPADQCHSRFLLYMAGNTWASRMKKLLLCNSTVVVHPSPFVGFWWHLLEHGKNVVVMEPIKHPDKASKQLMEVVKGLLSNISRSQDIAAEGQRLAVDVLTMENALDYWHHLLWEYARLQRFTPLVHHDAITLDKSIYLPQPSMQTNFSQRLCHICLPQPSDNKTLAAFTGEHYLSPKPE
ncbi:hypothetical protein WJX74_008187 [Apatococcus lobatus]|uniref:Glycosyl transferase CAP10 domain-containing protein n=1 Tax=Apatococcus lobatus TaxID=904363 RepID=A0AAW1RD52_9CHLO